MSFNLDDVQVGGTLRVGTGVCPAVKDSKNGNKQKVNKFKN